MSAKPETPAKEKAPGKGGGILGILLPALLAGGAAFGGARLAPARTAQAAHEPAAHHVAPPGATMSLEPFLVTITDGAKKMHAMKVTVAIEFDAHTKEEALKGLIPRVRDALLAALRALVYEDATDPSKGDKMRAELLERVKTAGAPEAQRVLITDLVVQ